MAAPLKKFTILIPIAACLIGAAVWWLYFHYQFSPKQGLNVSDAIVTLDLGQIARRVAEGDGFTTGFIRPVSLRFNPDILHHPELTHPPLYILVLAAAIKLAGPHDLTLAAVSIIFFWTAVPWIWFFSRAFFDNRIAGAAILLYCINPVMLRASINGSPVTFTVFLFFLLFYCLYRCRPASRFFPAAAGAVVGLAYLTRYSYGLWLFPGLFFLALEGREHRGRRIGFFIGAAVLATVPWLIRNGAVTGGPFFTLEGYKPSMFTDPRPGYILWRGFSAPSLMIPKKFFFIMKKSLLGLRESYLRVLLLTGNFAGVFALLTAFFRFPDGKFDRLKYVMFLMLGLECGYLSVFSPAGQGTAVLIPWAGLAGGAYFFHLISRMEHGSVLTRALAVVFFFILCAIPITDKLGPRLVPRLRIYSVENIRSVCASLPPGSVLVSDVPWAVAWYGRTSSIWLPYRIEDYEEIRIYRKPDVAGFFLTPFYGGEFFAPGEISPDWRKVYQTGWIPGGWGLGYKTTLPDSHIFISREPFQQ
ncbi:MAG: glycosyltransferase family 39 protein [PVC group bacterium]